MINGGISIEAAQKYVEDGVGDLVSFGGLFIANANLPQLISAGLGTAEMNPGEE
jgi:2,4-dienoyl-CoA reductase-like NADH-dependent reductase (Old Yellow Enzyme family)